MTESREPGDRDAKRRKTPDVQEEKQQEKVREKPKEVSEEGTPMDSTPSQADENPESELREVEVKTEHEEEKSEIGKQGTEVVAGYTKGTGEATQKSKRVSLNFPFRKREDGDDDISAKKTVNRQEEEDLKRAIELSKESLVLASMGLNPNAPGSTSNDLSPREFEFEFESSSTGMSSSYEEVASNSGEMPEDPERLLLFEMQIPRSNWLVIRAEAANKFFPTLPAYCKSNMEVELKILDCNKQEWEMTLVNYIEENVYLISKGWYEFTEWHNLYPTDVISFHTPLDLDHYDINFARLGENVVSIPEYGRGDLLFELELQLADIGYTSTLSLPTTDVETHFPAVKIVPGTSHTKQIVKFTDVISKDWYMEITLHNGTAYMITYGWGHFVGEYQLEAMDRIMFYMPAQQLHAKHFLIRYVRKKVGERSEDENPSRLSHQAKGKQKVIDF